MPDYTNNPSYRNYNYYFLCDRYISSAAAYPISYVNINRLGISIGQPVNVLKKGYTNSLEFHLPNSNLKIYVYTLAYFNPDTTSKSEFIEPQIILNEDEIDRYVEENIVNGNLNLNHIGKNNPASLLNQP